MTITHATRKRAKEKLAALDVNDIKAAVIALAKEMPFHTPKETCQYHGGKASRCVFGEVFYRNGLTEPELRSLDVSVDAFNMNRIEDLIGVGGDDWFAWVQDEQDDGATWGAAVESANRRRE